MADVSNEKSRLIDGMPRDKRGFWQPERGTAPPSPLFAWPPRPAEAFKWLFGFPGLPASVEHRLHGGRDADVALPPAILVPVRRVPSRLDT